jgi:transposase
LGIPLRRLGAIRVTNSRLFKQTEHLTDEQVQTLTQAFEGSPQLKKAYELRNSIYTIFELAQNKAQARTWLERWDKEVRSTKKSAWDKFLKILGNCKELILHFVDSGISNAVTEGLNNLIRYMRRLSFGVPNFEHMRLRILASSA